MPADGCVRPFYPDPHGYDTWDDERSARVFVHLVNSMTYREITGNEPPATPVTARSYTDAGLPWFDLYDEARGGVSRSDVLDGVKSVKEIDREKGFAPQQDYNPVQVSSGQVVVLGDKTGVVDGTW